MTTEIIVDLSQPPKDRWTLNNEQIYYGRELVRSYFIDLGMTQSRATDLLESVRPVIPQAYLGELSSIAQQLDLPLSHVVTCNCYYDLVKAAFGCTAFAVDGDTGPMHARNLDWWTENGLLQKSTMVSRFIGAKAGEFVTIGWPAFTGAFSAMAPGRFSISLNAVLSTEPMQLALPVVYLIRSVLEEAANYEAAVSRLKSETIPCDCLLLVCGVEEGEMCVIERTPTQHAVRHTENGLLLATNDYLEIDCESTAATGQIQETSCGRFSRMKTLLGNNPGSLEGCLDYLSDPDVRMSITVQQMAFSARAGRYLLRPQ